MRRLSYILLSLVASTLAVEFKTMDLFVESGEVSLGAWQIELRYDPQHVSLTGIEATLPNAKPPVYDSRGLQSGHITLADFTLHPNGFGSNSVHVARLHLAEHTVAEFHTQLKAAASTDGTKLPRATAFLRPVAHPGLAIQPDSLAPAVQKPKPMANALNAAPAATLSSPTSPRRPAAKEKPKTP